MVCDELAQSPEEPCDKWAMRHEGSGLAGLLGPRCKGESCLPPSFQAHA